VHEKAHDGYVINWNETHACCTFCISCAGGFGPSCIWAVFVLFGLYKLRELRDDGLSPQCPAHRPTAA
jgi:hypothetical protein